MVPTYWSSSWRTRLGPIRQLRWTSAAEDHHYLYTKPPLYTCTSFWKQVQRRHTCHGCAWRQLGSQADLFSQASTLLRHSHCRTGTVLLPPQSCPQEQCVQTHRYLNTICQTGANLAQSWLPVTRGGWQCQRTALPPTPHRSIVALKEHDPMSLTD